LFVLVGWWLWYKVTYLYYRVSTAKLATPKALFEGPKKAAKALDPSLPRDEDLARYYSRDMAEVLRYTPVATSDPDSFLQLAESSQVPESEGIFCSKC